MLQYLFASALTVARMPLNCLFNFVDPPVVVLVYHRVTALRSDPEMLAVTPDNFRAQMRYLRETVPVVRFEDDWSQIKKPAVAITFDDGYADNVLEALPILEEVRVPATFFVSTGNIGTHREFWWHELERLILGEKNIPPRFILNDNCFGREWTTGTVAERWDFYHGLVALMNKVDARLRGNWLIQLRHWAQENEVKAGIHRAMTVEELRRLASSEWVTIGAHTITHTRLSSLPVEGQREEIVESKRQLEAWAGRGIPVFSYPFGRRCDYTRESVALCRKAGFIKVAANFPGVTHSWTDPYQIPRRLVRNWPVEIFARKLGGFWIR